jgi:signal transduction histidine kinase
MPRISTRTATGHTVLVVDDHLEVLDSVRGLLEHEGHRVLTAHSGQRALEVLKREEVHVIVLDYLMPRMNGAEMVAAVRRFDPYVQIVLHTGYAGDLPPRDTIAALDIQGYHHKTDDPERLLLWVDVALRTYRLLMTLRERERLHEELVANCSHEFRTPVNVICGYAELLLGDSFGALPETAGQPVRSILNAARSLGDMVTDFLQYASVNAGVAQVVDQSIAVPELAVEMGNLATTLIGDRPVVFSCALDGAPARIRTDGVKLRTIMRNLVVNAVKFTERGTITLTIRQKPDGVRMEVRDTGPGISPEHHEAIFEPFRQLDGSMTREQGGVGLGLALSRKLARLLGGDLRVESVPGRGSSFVARLPALPLTRAATDTGLRPAASA